MKRTFGTLSLFATGILFVPLTAFAANCGVNTTVGSPNYGKVTQCSPGSSNIAGLIQNITNWILGFGGALAVLMIIYGGIVYVTSSGNEKRISLAKQILTFAIIGLIVILLSAVIVQFVAQAINSAQAGS